MQLFFSLLILKISSTFLLISANSIVRLRSLKISGNNKNNINGIENCLSELKTRICDPDNILNFEQLDRINEALIELEQSTNVTFYPAPPLWEFENAAKCPSSGLALSLIIVKKLEQPDLATKRISDLHKKWTELHPCSKTAIVLAELNTNKKELNDGQLRRRSPEALNDALSNTLLHDPKIRFSNKPIMVGAQFIGISSANSDVPSLELAQHYFRQSRFLNEGQVTEAIEGMVGDLRKNMMLRM
uniref:Uncharacterized protein n=3 Tax=Meloidogyne TaxID=189290 RepID=A0A915N616_MELJA